MSPKCKEQKNRVVSIFEGAALKLEENWTEISSSVLMVLMLASYGYSYHKAMSNVEPPSQEQSIGCGASPKP